MFKKNHNNINMNDDNIMVMMMTIMLHSMTTDTLVTRYVNSSTLQLAQKHLNVQNTTQPYKPRF